MAGQPNFPCKYQNMTPVSYIMFRIVCHFVHAYARAVWFQLGEHWLVASDLASGISVQKRQAVPLQKFASMGLVLQIYKGLGKPTLWDGTPTDQTLGV